MHARTRPSWMCDCDEELIQEKSFSSYFFSLLLLFWDLKKKKKNGHELNAVHSASIAPKIIENRSIKKQNWVAHNVNGNFIIFVAFLQLHWTKKYPDQTTAIALDDPLRIHFCGNVQSSGYRFFWWWIKLKFRCWTTICAPNECSTPHCICISVCLNVCKCIHAHVYISTNSIESNHNHYFGVE